MNIKELQTMVYDLYKIRGYTDDLVTLALGLCEEAGEVGKAINTYYNPKYVPSSKNNCDTLEHELCDALVYLIGIANSAGIDLTDELEKKFAKISD